MWNERSDEAAPRPARRLHGVVRSPEKRDSVAAWRVAENQRAASHARRGCATEIEGLSRESTTRAPRPTQDAVVPQRLRLSRYGNPGTRSR